MKILAVAPQPFFGYRGTPFSVYYRTMMMAEQGVEIDLLTYGQGMDVDLPNVRIIRIPDFKFLGPIPIGPSLLKLFLDQFIFIWMIGLLIRNKYDAVHAHEEAVFFSAFMKPIFRFKQIYDMHSSLPQQLKNFSFSKSKLLIKIFTALENYSIRKSDALITICPDLYNYVEGEMPGVVQNHFLIENSIFEPVKISAKEGSAKQAQPEPVVTIPDGVRTVVYAGTLEHYQGIDILVKSFRHVRAACDDAFLVVVGGTPEQADSFRKMAAEEGVAEHCFIHPRVPQMLAKRLCSEAEVQMSPRSTGTNTPLKVYEQLASGVPLVATDIYSHTQVLNHDVCYLVKPDPENLAKGIVQALNDGKAGNPKAQAAIKLYEEKYSRPIYTRKITQLLECLG